MKPPLPAILYSTGLLLAFGAGWFLKQAVSPDNSAALSHSALPAKRPAPPIPQTPSDPEGADGGNWLEAASADVAAVRAAMQPGVINNALIDKLRAALELQDVSHKHSRWQALIAEMKREDVLAVQSIFLERRKNGQFDDRTLYDSFVHRWGMIDGPAAAASSAASVEEGYNQTIMSGWAKKNAAQAKDWLEAQDFNPYLYNQYLRGIVDGLFVIDPDAAEALLLSRGSDARLHDFLSNAIQKRQGREGFESAKKWFSEIASREAPDAFKRENLSAFILVNSGTEPGRDAELIILSQKYQNEDWLPQSAGNLLGKFYAESNPAAGLQALMELKSVTARQAAAEVLVEKWAQSDPVNMSLWLANHPDHILFDQTASELARRLLSSDPEAAQAWAGQIKDAKLKSRASEPSIEDPFATDQ